MGELTLRLRAASQRPAIQGGFMAAAMVVAGGFDYLVNIVVGRQLPPTEFFIFVTVTALLQVMVQVTNVIRNVVAYYTAEATVGGDAAARVGSVLGRSWRWAWRWGVAATALMALLSPLLARFLHIPTPWPLWAASLALLLLFLRPVTDGVLQGTQHFFGLGAVQMLQSLLRLLFAAALLWLQAAGAVVALPLGSAIALGLALVLLRPYFRAPAPAAPPRAISWGYSAYTLLGLLAFAVMANADAIVVRRIFGDAAAEAYAPVVTLGKMNLFIPLGIGLVLFPKATQRRAAGRDPRPVLLLALAATLLPGLLLTALYALWPGEIVALVFGPAYSDPGRLLALVGLATTLYAAVNIWLNYALSLERRAYVLVLAAIVVGQVAAMLLFHGRLESVAWAMVGAAVAANVVGVVLLLLQGSRGAGEQG
jgi:O-antigen/teichoic acid export membrane protein